MVWTTWPLGNNNSIVELVYNQAGRIEKQIQKHKKTENGTTTIIGVLKFHINTMAMGIALPSLIHPEKV